MTTNKIVEKLLFSAWQARADGKYDLARKFLGEALELCNENEFYYLGRIFHIYMQFESDQDNFQKALEHSNQSVAYYQESGNINKTAHSTRHKADLQFQIGLESEAELNYRKAIELYRSTKETSKLDLANALRGFGVLLASKNEKDEALQVWNEVKNLYNDLKLQRGVNEANEQINLLGSK